MDPGKRRSVGGNVHSCKLVRKQEDGCELEGITNLPSSQGKISRFILSVVRVHLRIWNSRLQALVIQDN